MNGLPPRNKGGEEAQLSRLGVSLDSLVSGRFPASKHLGAGAIAYLVGGAYPNRPDAWASIV